MTIYAINRATKEHRRITLPEPGVLADFRGWSIVDADADGWIPWSGGGCPLPDGHPVDVKHKDGDVLCSTWAGKDYAEDWNHREHDGDIIAYRPILDEWVAENVEPKAPEWSGEGLPPVGFVVDLQMTDDEWEAVEILAHKDGGFVAWHVEEQIPKRAPVWYAGDENLRPIRSAEDRAVEEMARSATDFESGMRPDHRKLVAVCRALYRAGYRRE